MTHRPGPVIGLVLALACSIVPWLASPSAGTQVAAAALPAWHGGIALYRRGTFTTQKSWLWCTAADVQIIRNITRRQTDHSTTSQRRYFTWMRGRNRYDLPLSAGVDPAGWTAGLRHFVDDRYRLVASRTFAAALKSAVTNLRRTNLPVGITVARGNHAWILTGFSATADPLLTTSFSVTSVRVVGPLYGLQSRNGYDMAPDRKLTTAQFKRFFTPWRYAPKRMIWDGRYVSIQPIPTTPAAAGAAATASAPPPSAAAAASVQASLPSPSLDVSGSPSPAVAIVSDAAPTSRPSSGAFAVPASTASSGSEPSLPQAVGLLTAGVAVSVLVFGIGRSVGGLGDRPRRHEPPPTLGRHEPPPTLGRHAPPPNLGRHRPSVPVTRLRARPRRRA